MNLFIDIFTKIFFILSPFFSVSMFLSLSKDMDPVARKRAATRTSVAIFVLCFVVYFFGNLIFKVLGITVAAFQVAPGHCCF